MNYSESKSNIAEDRTIRCNVTGTGASAPTVRAGQAVTVTRTGAGVYRYTFADNPGTFVGVDGWAVRAGTPSAVKGYSLSAGTYVAPASGARGYIEVSLWDSANAAVDLAAAQYLDVTFAFAAQSRIT